MTSSTTEGYAPIEQYNGMGSAGAYSDVYALAATLYHLLTARVPIPSTFRSYATLPAPQHFHAKISDRVNLAIMKGMEQVPAARPQMMQEFRELLGLVSQPPTAMKPQPIPTAQPSQTAQLSQSINLSDWHKTLVAAQTEATLSLPSTPTTTTTKTILRSGSFWRGSNVELEILYIPEGSFRMGSLPHEKSSISSERPQHEVQISAFYMSKFPITQAQYFAVMGRNPSQFSGDRRPVENVSWHDAIEFCQRLAATTGLH